MEVGNNMMPPSLDVLIIRTSKSFVSTIYRKLTSIGLCISKDAFAS